MHLNSSESERTFFNLCAFKSQIACSSLIYALLIYALVYQFFPLRLCPLHEK